MTTNHKIVYALTIIGVLMLISVYTWAWYVVQVPNSILIKIATSSLILGSILRFSEDDSPSKSESK